MFHLIRSGDAFGVVNVADNGRVLSENYGFNRKENAYNNMYAQVASATLVSLFKVAFQDDTLDVPKVFWLTAAIKKEPCFDALPRKKYIQQKNKKK